MGLLPSGSLQCFSLAALLIICSWFYCLKKKKKDNSASKIPFWSSQLRFPPPLLRAPVHSHLNFLGESRLYRGKAFRRLVVLGPMSLIGEMSGWQYRWQSIVTWSQQCFFLFLDIRQRLGKRPYSPEKTFSSNPVVRREPFSDVHSRLGVPRQDVKGLYSDTREKKSGW